MELCEVRPSCEDAVLPLKALGTTPKSGEQVEEHPQRSVDARELSDWSSVCESSVRFSCFLKVRSLDGEGEKAASPIFGLPARAG